MSIENLQIAKLQRILHNYDNAPSYGAQQAAMDALIRHARSMVDGEDFEEQERRKLELSERLSKNIKTLRSLQGILSKHCGE